MHLELETRHRLPGLMETALDIGKIACCLVAPFGIPADARTDEPFVFVTGRKPLRCTLVFSRPEIIATVLVSRHKETTVR